MGVAELCEECCGVIWLLLPLFLTSCGSDKGTSQRTAEKTSSYPVGYRSIPFVDSSRTYRPGVGKSDKLYFRPIDADVWYPAQPVSSD